MLPAVYHQTKDCGVSATYQLGIQSELNRYNHVTLFFVYKPVTMSGMRGILANWFERHRHPASLALHAIGIPMLMVGLLLGAWQLWHGLWPLWWRPVGLIVVSYILQAIGHAIEGNDMGEVVLIKRLLGKPYVAVAPRTVAPRADAPPELR